MNHKIVFFGIVVIVLILFLTVANQFVNAQMSLGSIQSATENEDTRNCEYISIQNAYTPLRMYANFPTTPNVSLVPHGENPQTQFQSTFGNDFFEFATNSTDIFTITFNADYEFEDTLPRNFFYEIFTKDNENRHVGSWQITDTSTCKVFELDARPPQHILTDEEIIANIAEWEQKQHTITQNKQDTTNDLITVIVISVVSVGFTFFIIIIFMRFSKSKDTANAIYATQQFSKQVQKFQETMVFMKKSTEYGDVKLDYILSEIKQALKDVMFGMNLHNKIVKDSAFKPRMAMPKETVEKQEEKAMSTASKVFDTLKSALIESDKEPEKKLSLYVEYNKLTQAEIIEQLRIMDKKIASYHSDLDFKTKYDILMKVYKDRYDIK